ncbi:hypothetical protein ACH4E8_00080 [Streptomyces sp. NPDC017979]|uniref:hypothetical protein n=1 Tax=Streptomyces sp. NPDC017979 TaxID=3365024 RepID=UPI0037ADBE2A
MNHLAPRTSPTHAAARASSRPASAKATIATITTLSLALSGCSSDEPPKPKKLYTVPTTLCGAAVPPDLLTAVLPPGKKLHTKPWTSGYNQSTCRVFIDNEPVLVAQYDWQRKERTIFDTAPSLTGLDRKKDVNPERTLGYTEKGGVTKAACPNPARSEYKTWQLFVYITTYKDEGTKEDMKNLVTAYGKGMTESSECTSKGRTT